MPRLRAAASPRLAARASSRTGIDGRASMNRRTTSTPSSDEWSSTTTISAVDGARRLDRLERLGDESGVVVQRHHHADLGRVDTRVGHVRRCRVLGDVVGRSVAQRRPLRLDGAAVAALGDQRLEHALADGRRRAELAQHVPRLADRAAQGPRPPAGAGTQVEAVDPLEDRTDRGRQRMPTQHRVGGGGGDLVPSRRALEQLGHRGGQVVGLDEVLARAQRRGAGARLGDHHAAVGHRLDHARPLEVAGTPVVAVDVDEELGRGEEAVLVGAEHEAGRAGAHRRREAEQA